MLAANIATNAPRQAIKCETSGTFAKMKFARMTR